MLQRIEILTHYIIIIQSQAIDAEYIYLLNRLV